VFSDIRCSTSAASKFVYFLSLISVIAIAILIVALPAFAADPQQAVHDQPSQGRQRELPPPCEPDWTLVAPPPDGTQRHLFAVDAAAANDVWAVGTDILTGTLAMHWNGAVWSNVPTPAEGTTNTILHGVAAVSANDVWAVGYYHNPNLGDVDRTLILHWNGSVWSRVTSPNSGGGNNYLRAVTALSANDVWAVGYYRDTVVNHDMTLTLHWNGIGWTQVASPNAGSNVRNNLYGVTAVAADGVWAVGGYNGGTLTEHWNGTAWSIVSSPGPTASAVLRGVAAVAPDDVWGVGDTGNEQTLAMHWNGSTWSVAPSPNVELNDSLLAVTAVGTDVWAAGYAGFAGAHTLILRWGGGVWSVVTSPDAGDTNMLLGIVAIAANDVWAVGYYQVPGEGEHIALMERYHPCVPSPTPSRTLTPGNTPTPGASPTACAMQFTDVLPGSTFHSYVRCMACQGIINGYTSGCESGDPCFRPNNSVTRGQLAKIVANAAGFTEAAGAQQYEDVPAGSTFYDFVWRLSSRGYVNGYPCGGAGEPCGPNSLPYFRPNGTATRGQISKIVANAAQFTDPPGDQAFEDVPPSQTFYDFIQRLANRTIMGGYPCGGVGEPCVPPGNLPYFRPANNATRGQVSKIVANTFFPDCDIPTR
jgi:hypothetical protein